MFIEHVRATIRALSLILLIVSAFPFIGLIWLLRLETIRGKLVQWFYWVATAICGISICVKGKASTHRPLLLVTNHCSYLDVFVLGSVMPVRFTPKTEVRRWPVIGGCCVLAGCLFIDRKRTKIKENEEMLRKAMQGKTVVCLFPEGSTNDGLKPLPFKSTFFRLLEEPVGGEQAQVQPASIAYTKYQGIPISSHERPEIAWYGDMEFFAHFWRVLQFDHIEVHLTFLDPIGLGEGATRKSVSALCEQMISTDLENELRKAA